MKLVAAAQWARRWMHSPERLTVWVITIMALFLKADGLC